MTTARMGRPYSETALPTEKPGELEDPVDRRLVDRGIRGQRHHSRLAVGLSAHGGRDDVDALLAEDRADPADHPRLVGVAEDRQVVGDGQIEILAPDSRQVRDVARSDPGAGHLHDLVTGVEPDDDQLGEVLRGRIPRLGQLDAPLLGHVRAVDQVDRLLRVTGEDPDEGGDAQDPSVLIGQSAAEFNLHAVGCALPERLREAAELLAEGHERGQLLHHLRADRGDVDRRCHHASGERRGHLLRSDHSGAVLRLRGRGAEVRRDDHVIALQDWMTAEWLLGEDVERGARRASLTRGPRPGRPGRSARRGRSSRFGRRRASARWRRRR